MSGETTPGHAADGLGGPRAHPPVSIVVPVYGEATLLAACLASLRRHAPGCHVVVADDATPGESVADVARSFAAGLSLDYVRRERNVGFVENCNDAIRSILPTGRDVLLLNSDTKVTAGFLEEMWEVLQAHETHGAVSPRSNNATIFTVPVFEQLPPDESYELWQGIKDLLPRYQVMPTGVGFCLLLRNAILRQVGLFDPVYSPGYNEENDLICRMNRLGYSAIVAHRAFVFHLESASFGLRKKRLERRNRRILDDRYPEYLRKVTDYRRYGVDPIDHFAPLWLPHKPVILIDLFHLPAKYSEASEFALSLLLHLVPLLETTAEVFLGLSETARQFFLGELTGYRFYNAERQVNTRFDLVFKPSRVLTWAELRRMVKLGGRLAFTHADCLALRRDDLSDAATRILFRTSVELADHVITINQFSKADFAAFSGTSVPFEIIPLGAHDDPPVIAHQEGYVLVVGNRSHHEAVQRTLEELPAVPRIVALGGEDSSGLQAVRLSAEMLSRSRIAALFDGAAVVVYSRSHEGFGLPIVDAIALGLRVVAFDTALNQEMGASTNDRSFVLVNSHSELREAVARILSEPRGAVAADRRLRRWPEIAGQYARSLGELLGRDIDLGLIRRRWDLVTTVDAVQPLS